MVLLHPSLICPYILHDKYFRKKLGLEGITSPPLIRPMQLPLNCKILILSPLPSSVVLQKLLYITYSSISIFSHNIPKIVYLMYCLYCLQPCFEPDFRPPKLGSLMPSLGRSKKEDKANLLSNTDISSEDEKPPY